jgi:hypothetical protein
MPNPVMLSFNFDGMQARSRSAFESDMHGSEEQSEGEKMEVDSVVALES